jgi:bifunctional UDP-N-acetylglucosamine pyrophosphorylase/glucosamine-1-phosphate N-acetyltransferase
MSLTWQTDKVALILAAGKGRRMKSDLPKALHKLHGKYIVDHVIDSARKAGIERQILVVGYQAEKVSEALADRGVDFALQAEQKGTGHAVIMAQPMLEGFDGDLVVLCGDMPLIRPETIRNLIAKRHELGAAAVVLTAVLDDPASYGRVVRDQAGMVRAIVEYRDADDSIRAIKEVNTGTFCFDWKKLRPVLGRLDDNNAQKEYYLTDSVSIFVKEDERVGALVASDPSEGLGINSTGQLADLEKIIKNGT